MQTTFDVEASIKIADGLEAHAAAMAAPMHPPIDFVNLAEQYKTNEQKILEALVAIRTDIRSMLDLYINAEPSQPTDASASMAASSTGGKTQKMFSGKARR